jgi:hypothetical protein
MIKWMVDRGCSSCLNGHFPHHFGFGPRHWRERPYWRDAGATRTFISRLLMSSPFFPNGRNGLHNDLPKPDLNITVRR